MFKEGESDLLGQMLLVEEGEDKQMVIIFGKMKVVGDFMKSCFEEKGEDRHLSGVGPIKKRRRGNKCERPYHLSEDFAIMKSIERGQWLERKEGSWSHWLVCFEVDEIVGYLFIDGKIH